jgi:hypothetical protein
VGLEEIKGYEESLLHTNGNVGAGPIPIVHVAFGDFETPVLQHLPLFKTG